MIELVQTTFLAFIGACGFTLFNVVGDCYDKIFLEKSISTVKEWIQNIGLILLCHIGYVMIFLLVSLKGAEWGYL